MKTPMPGLLRNVLLAATLAAASVADANGDSAAIGRHAIRTIPFDNNLQLRTATYTPSGKVLVAYSPKDNTDERQISLAVMDDDGSDMKTFFTGTIPPRDKDNGIRFMVFADNQRIFLGDFILECAPGLDQCDRNELLPVDYPAEVADGEHISHRWSEMIIAPDNEHVAWTTLFSNYAAAMFTGRLARDDKGYRIVEPEIVSTLQPFSPDPKHADGVIPSPVRNGEVKQFVNGGAGISLVGAVSRDIADSVVQDLATGELTQITHNPGYDETTIFSPDGQLGITMSARFSPATDLAILGLLPRPYPASLNMGLNMHSYTYSVVGVRRARSGNAGPVLIDIEASKSRQNYRGINLNTEDEWVFRSPMSWHPGSKKALWMEGLRGAGARHEIAKRIQVVELPDYQPGQPVPVKAMPTKVPYGSSDLSEVKNLAQKGNEIDVTVYGRHSGHITYRRTARGLIEKQYVNFSDDGQGTYSGSETMQLNPRGQSTYNARLTLSGPEPGAMDLQVTFGPIEAELPAELIFSRDQTGAPLTYGYSEYNGVRMEVEKLTH